MRAVERLGANLGTPADLSCDERNDPPETAYIPIANSVKYAHDPEISRTPVHHREEQPDGKGRRENQEVRRAFPHTLEMVEVQRTESVE